VDISLPGHVYRLLSLGSSSAVLR